MYIYAADCYCDACGEDIKQRILKELGKKPEDFDDERTYDSGEFPKGPFDDEAESDSPQHCASGEDCLDPTIIADNNNGEDHVVGHFFENNLTTTGVEYLKDMHKNQRSEITEYWVDYYRANGYSHEFPDTEEENDREQTLAAMSEEELRNCLEALCVAIEDQADIVPSRQIIEDAREVIKQWGLQ